MDAQGVEGDGQGLAVRRDFGMLRGQRFQHRECPRVGGLRLLRPSQPGLDVPDPHAGPPRLVPHGRFPALRQGTFLVETRGLPEDISLVFVHPLLFVQRRGHLHVHLLDDLPRAPEVVLGASGEGPLPFGTQPELVGREARAEGRSDEEGGHGRRQPGDDRLAAAPSPEPLRRPDRAGKYRPALEEAPQVVGELRRRLIPPGRLLLEALQADRLQVRAGRRGTSRLGGDRLGAADLLEGLASRSPPWNGGRPVSSS